MVTSGTPSPIRAFQKRLSVVIAVLGLFGSFALGLIWRDSMKYFTAYSTQKGSIFIFCSSVSYTPESLKLIGLDEPYVRTKSEYYGNRESPIFPLPEMSHGTIRIPIYLLILAYLSTLLLIWIILMNLLARRGFTKETSTPAEH